MLGKVAMFTFQLLLYKPVRYIEIAVIKLIYDGCSGCMTAGIGIPSINLIIKYKGKVSM